MKSALQQRAEIELSRLIEMERSRRSAPSRLPWRRSAVPNGDSDHAGRRELERFRFSLEALALIGALPESEVESWMARYGSEAAAERWPDVGSDPTTDRRARTLLDERLPAADLDPNSEDYTQAIWRFKEAQAAINITGALSDEEQARWQERFLDRVSPEDRRKLRSTPACKALDLERVVPGPSLRHGGVRVTQVELYADGVVVHWHHAVQVPKPPGRELTDWERSRAEKRALDFGMLELSDDAGSSYRWWPGPSHDAAFRKDGFVHWGSAAFTPAVGKGATRLFVSREGNTFEIPIA